MKLKFFTLLLIALAIPDAQATRVDTFVTPDSSFASLQDFIAESSDSLMIASYTFGSPDVMNLILEKHEEGVHVEVLVEKSPAGGMPDGDVRILGEFLDNDVTVLLYDGPLKYMHGKYIIRDHESVLVTSENFGYTGFFPGGDYGNRGWGASAHDGSIARGLEEIYEEDREDSVPFTCTSDNNTISGNIIMDNNEYGVYFSGDSENNLLYNNVDYIQLLSHLCQPSLQLCHSLILQHLSQFLI